MEKEKKPSDLSVLMEAVRKRPDSITEELELIKIFKNIIAELKTNERFQTIKNAMLEEIQILETCNVELSIYFDSAIYEGMLDILDEIEREIMETSN